MSVQKTYNSNIVIECYKLIQHTIKKASKHHYNSKLSSVLQCNSTHFKIRFQCYAFNLFAPNEYNMEVKMIANMMKSQNMLHGEVKPISFGDSTTVWYFILPRDQYLGADTRYEIATSIVNNVTTQRRQYLAHDNNAVCLFENKQKVESEVSVQTPLLSKVVSL